MNLMTAGRGIAHSERTPDAQRGSGQQMLGLQSWIALPAGRRRSRRRSSISARATCRSSSAFTARVIAGSAFGMTSPVAMVSPWFYVEVTALAGACAPLDPDYEERAIYVVDGEVEFAGERYEGPRLLIFRPGDRITLTAFADAHDVSRRRRDGGARAISGGISCPRARSGSSRPRRTGNRPLRAGAAGAEFIPLPE